MGWTAYRLIYEAKSPIHIGWHTLGYINLTRYYIPGKVIWGAFTANLTRAGVDTDPRRYRTYGDLLRKDILVSYFYPALDCFSPLLPKYTDIGLRYGNVYSSEDFEKMFISSFGQTAILPESNTKEDESLHESEFIAPIAEIRQNKRVPVYFVGYLFVNDNASIQTGNGERTAGWEDKDINIRTIVSELYVGGDRKYGWGRLVLDEHHVEKNVTEFFGYSFDPDNDMLYFAVPEGNPIPAHLPVSSGLPFKGDIEPLVGREWDGKGPGQTIKNFAEGMYWVPGSVLQEERHLKIGPYGILYRG